MKLITSLEFEIQPIPPNINFTYVIWPGGLMWPGMTLTADYTLPPPNKDIIYIGFDGDITQLAESVTTQEGALMLNTLRPKGRLIILTMEDLYAVEIAPTFVMN